MIYRFLTYSNFYISLVAGIVSLGTGRILELNHFGIYALFVFFSTLSTYTFQRMSKVVGSNAPAIEITTWYRKHQSALWLLIGVSFVIAISIFVCLPFSYFALGGLSVCALLSVFYIVKAGRTNLREIPFLKMHLIALVWCSALIFVPLLQENDFALRKWLFGCAHYLYFLAICILFDIRDLKYDKKELCSIPQIFGERKAKGIALLLFFLFTVIIYCLYPHFINSYLFGIVILLHIPVFLYASSDRSNSYFSFLVDGVMLLLGMGYISTYYL